MLHKYFVVKNIKTGEEILIHEEEDFESLIDEDDEWEIVDEIFSR